MKKKLKLLYIVDNHTYMGSFDRLLFREQLLKLIEWFPQYRTNAILLYDIIPELEYILVKQSNFPNHNIIKYKLLNNTKEQAFNFVSRYNIIEDFLLEYCIQIKDKVAY